MLSNEIKQRVITAQKSELTEHFIYEKLSRSVKDRHNRDIMKRISGDELRHHDFLKTLSSIDVKPKRFKMWMYYIFSRIFGITFSIKLMESGEGEAQINYREISSSIPAVKDIVLDEHEHENELIAMIDEERLRYIGAIIRGLNEALVELTGALAGLTLALQDSDLVARYSVPASERDIAIPVIRPAAAIKSESGNQRPVKAALYTGFANVLTVAFLIFPFFIFSNIYFSLGLMLFNAILVIFIFNFFISVTRELSFKRKFTEMAIISLGIAGITFLIGLLARNLLHLEV
jgi:VIT1/CCC1 family predicted Fe2+/Mn2+ transporter